MNFIRKAVAIIITCVLFTLLFLASVAASFVILAIGIIMLIYVRYKKPEVFNAKYTQARRTDVIDGEYRVIETTQVIDKKD
jgi:hypothetical protein